MNLLILGYYENEGGYKAAIDNFKHYFDNVYFFPLIYYLHNKKEKLIPDLKKTIIEKKITYVIIWHNISTIRNIFSILKEINVFKDKHKIKIININWDPDPQFYNDKSYQKYFDLIYVANPFLINSNKCLPFFQGYNPKQSFYKFDKDYICDVVFIGTNLYTDEIWENKKLNRKIVLDEITKCEQINLNIYSLENDRISQEYNKYYKGFIPYDKCYLAFSNALFSLNISPLNNVSKNGYHYYSERLPQILGCNSLMISNNDYSGLLTPNEDYIYLTDINKLNDIIIEYKNNPEKCSLMRENYKKKLHIFDYSESLKHVSYRIKSLSINNIKNNIKKRKEIQKFNKKYIILFIFLLLFFKYKNNIKLKINSLLRYKNRYLSKTLETKSIQEKCV